MAEENIPEGGRSTETGSVDRDQGTRHKVMLKGTHVVFAEGEEVKALYKELLRKKKAIKSKFTLSSEKRKASLT